MGCVWSNISSCKFCAPRAVNQLDYDTVRTYTDEVSVCFPAGDEKEIQHKIGELTTCTADREKSIDKSSRLSTQFFPADGLKTLEVPSGDYKLRYSFLSQRGYYPDALDKANQDSFCVHVPFGVNVNDHFFGVFDGHGEFGAECSQFVKQKLCENLLRNSKFNVDAVEAFHAAFLSTNEQLHADILDDSMSGTTAITVLVRDKILYIANAGDSRAVIGEKRGENIVAVDLSIDQTPFRLDELERVKLCGARVLTLDQIEGLKDPEVPCWGDEEGDDGDPPRLWVQNGMYPGTAFTRSIGDSVAETIGVTANPEIVVFKLTRDHPFFVIASDGVFEFLSSQTVVDMIAKHKDPHDACAEIVAESYRLWLQYETRTDDITLIVVHINGLKDDASGHFSNTGLLSRSQTPQVIELSGSESPSMSNWRSRNLHGRIDASRAQLHSLESSLQNGPPDWVPSSPLHRKTWEEETQIERALCDHFLFRKLTDSQIHVLLDCMQKVVVQAGDIVVKQGGEGDSFFVVGSGEFEVFSSQEEKDGEVPRILHHYTAEKLSSFGELVLMYNKPLQASVRAVTNGTLWSLKREDFRGILMSEFSNLSSLKLLRSLDIFSKLTILQLSHIADSLYEVSFSNGQNIVEENGDCLGLYIVQRGVARITCDMSKLRSVDASSLMSEAEKQDYDMSATSFSVEKKAGSYFGEWTLAGARISPMLVTAVGDVFCSVLTKDKFDSVLGSPDKLSQPSKHFPSNSSPQPTKDLDASTFRNFQLIELEWQTCVYSTDCCEIGLVRVIGTESMLSLKRFSKQKVKRLGKEALILKERNLLKSIGRSTFIPRVICTCSDRSYAGLLLDTRIVGSMSSIIRSKLDESSAKFCAASVVIALEGLHKLGILYRGVSPDDVLFDQTGYVQLVDFRFAKELSTERTYTMCGVADSLAPEVIEGKGHGFPADWWDLGCLMCFMVQNEIHSDRFVRGQLSLPQHISVEAADLIAKLLEVDENARIGSHGIRAHPWFAGFDWEGLAEGRAAAPPDIVSRINDYIVGDEEGVADTPTFSPLNEFEPHSTPEWLKDW